MRIRARFVGHAVAAALAVTLGTTGAVSAMPAQVPHASAETVAELTSDATRDVQFLLRQPDFLAFVHEALISSERTTVPLNEIMQRFDPAARTRTAVRLRQAGRDLRALKGLPEKGGDLLQLRAMLPEGTAMKDVVAEQFRIAATPMGEDRRNPSVRTYGADGSVLDIPMDSRPDFPLLLLEVDTRTALREGMAVINEGLRAHGLQTAPRARAAETLDVSRLDHIRLAVDNEPNLKGAAEIFAIVSGLQLDEKKPEMRTFEMPWLDHDKTDYYPAQDWIHWGNYRYDAANVQLFEEDGNTNYKTMLTALITVVGSTIGPIEPTVGMISLIADAVLQAMPDAWFIDEHDYVDSYYLLRRGMTYRAHPGAGRNAVVDLTPVTLGN